MFNKENAKKIDKIIEEKFPIIYEYDFDGIVLTWGGSIRNTIMNNHVKDLDFVIITQGKCQILDFIKKFKLAFYMNSGGGYKIFYKDFSVDIFSTDDLLDAAFYDADLLFYDINAHQFLICGATKAFEKGKITQINFDKSPLRKDKIRYKKINNFIMAMYDFKKVKVKRNMILWHLKMFFKNIHITLYKVFNGNYKKCYRFLRKFKDKYVILLILKILLILVYVSIPFFFGRTLINIFNSNKYIVDLIILLVLQILYFIFIIIASKSELGLVKNMEYNINREIVNSTLNFDLNDYNKDSFFNLLKSDSKIISNSFKLINGMLIEFIGGILMAFVILILNYKIGIVYFVFLFLSFLIIFRSVKRKRKFRGINFYDSDSYTSTYGNMIDSVKISNDKKRNINKLNFDEIYIKFISCLSFGIVTVLGFIFINRNLIDSATLILICIYTFFPFKYIINFGKIMDLITELNLSCYRLFNLIDGNLYVNMVFGKIYTDKCIGKIEFNNVDFKYNHNYNYVLNNCSFKIDSNKVVGLVLNSAKNNAILNLISRLYHSDNGLVKIDGVDITEYDEKYIRENIATISQNPCLFDMSIKDNLRLVKEDITDEEIIKVCKTVCLDEFIEKLPNKYDTVIGEGGIKLSGCQKQNLGIARAILKNTKIILLNNCNYDNKESYENFVKIINNMRKKYTIVIAVTDTNDALLSACDEVINFDN